MSCHPARSTDPGTSHEAARHVVASGLQADQQSVALIAVRQNPGLTSSELARRLPELLEAGQVFRGQKKVCDISHRSACTWWSVAPGQNLALVI